MYKICWKFINIIFILQTKTKKLNSEAIDTNQKFLKDFFMTDSISRASATMSKCVQAASKLIAS